MGLKESFNKHFYMNLKTVGDLEYEEHLILFHYLLKSLGNDWISKTFPNKTELTITLITTILLTYMFVSELNFIRNNMDNLFKMTECLMTLFLGVGLYIKFLILMYYSKEIKNLINEMKTAFNEARAEGGDRWEIMKTHIREARIITRIFYYFFIFVPITFVSIAVPHIKDYQMILPSGLIGFSTDEIYGYLANMAVHLWCMMLATNSLCGFGSIWLYLILTLCAQTEILGNKLLTMNNKTKPIENDEESLVARETSEEGEEWQFDYQYMEQYLNECFKLHQWIYRTSEIINEVYKFDCLTEIVLSTMVGCVSLYQVAERNDAPMQCYAYFVACIFQIFLYCWYGDLITHKSVAVSEAMYLSPWYRLNYRQQRLLYLMLMKTQRPITMSGIFIDVSLSTFTAVMKTTYSYYAVLSTTSN